jgi:hypothetical protein
MIPFFICMVLGMVSAGFGFMYHQMVQHPDFAPIDHIWRWLNGPKRRADELRKRADTHLAAFIAGDYETAMFGDYPPTALE